MAQYTCNANMAADLLPMLAKARLPFSLVWPRPDVAVFEGDQVLVNHIKSEATFLNLVAKDINFLPTGQWTITDDMAFPLTSPVDLREGFEPTSNLNPWEDATHQITFDGGKHWTNVIQDEGDPEYFVACSDGKRSWKVERFPVDQVVKRPIAALTPEQELELRAMTVTGRISDPQLWTATCRWPTGSMPFGGFPSAELIERQPASVGDAPACRMTDTEFDSDPSVVGE